MRMLVQEWIDHEIFRKGLVLVLDRLLSTRNL